MTANEQHREERTVYPVWVCRLCGHVLARKGRRPRSCKADHKGRACKGVYANDEISERRGLDTIREDVRT